MANDATGCTGEGECGFLGSGNDLGVNAQDFLHRFNEFVAVFRIAHCRGCDKTNLFGFQIVNHALVLMHCGKCSLDRLGSQSSRSINALPEAHNAHLARQIVERNGAALEHAIGH